MYKNEKSQKTEQKKRKDGKVVAFFRDFFIGKFLIKKETMEWYPYFAFIIIIIMLLTYNENVVLNKEQRNKELQDRHDSTVVEFRKRNEIIFQEDENKLRKKAEENGFVSIEDDDYYKIYREE